MLSKDKISFVLYTSFYEAVRDLPLDRKGMLLDIIFQYENGQFDEKIFAEYPPEVKMAFSFIRRNLDKDHEKWQETINQRVEAGKAGAAARWQNKAADGKNDKAAGNMAKNSKRIKRMANDGKACDPMAKMADNVVVNVNDSDSNNYTNDTTSSIFKEKKEKEKKEIVGSLVGDEEFGGRRAESEDIPPTGGVAAHEPARGELAPPRQAPPDTPPSAGGRQAPSPRIGNWNPHNEDVGIDCDWFLDFDDPIFAPYAKIPDSIKSAVEKWIRREKAGTIVSKRFIVEQFTNFARRQGKIKELLKAV
jgi:hypothetical protein